MTKSETARWWVTSEIDGPPTATRIMVGSRCVGSTAPQCGRFHTSIEQAEANALLIVALVNEHFEGLTND